MQWDASPHAGFTAPEATPWLPLAGDYRQRNVAAQDGDPDSMLNFFRRLTALRRAEPALNRGAVELVDVGIENVLAYKRTWPGSIGYLVILNLGDETHAVDLRMVTQGNQVEVILSTEPSRVGHTPVVSFILGGNEGTILKVT